MFVASGCGGCHILEAAGGAGEVGPNLDETALDKAAIIDTIANGRNAMPAFSDQLAPEQIEAVADLILDGK